MGPFTVLAQLNLREIVAIKLGIALPSVTIASITPVVNTTGTTTAYSVRLSINAAAAASSAAVVAELGSGTGDAALAAALSSVMDEVVTPAVASSTTLQLTLGTSINVAATVPDPSNPTVFVAASPSPLRKFGRLAYPLVGAFT